MKAFIFVTRDGSTFQPNSVSIVPDIENLQVIGFAEGEDARRAFENLLSEDGWLRETSFNAVTSIELAHIDSENQSETFFIKGDVDSHNAG